MTRRVGLLIGVLVLLAAAAPSLAPYDPEVQHRDFLYAPPMRPHLVGEHGLTWPFVYRIAMADRLSQRYNEDRTQPLSLPWFEATRDTPVFLLGADSFGSLDWRDAATASP